MRRIEGGEWFDGGRGAPVCSRVSSAYSPFEYWFKLLAVELALANADIAAPRRLSAIQVDLRLVEPLMKRMDAALMKALPHLSRSDIFWGMKFTFGALHHWLLTKDKFLPAWVEEVDVERQTQKLISYAAAGLRAA
ncbi:MAG TPA: hypothetical protein VL793_03425 [Patescibacteria group bacterium]|nr:hypothetical protein [Patescibacteria group bacterium]